eukprot:jgi/Hompol1/3217/HPOL_001535-RA
MVQSFDGFPGLLVVKRVVPPQLQRAVARLALARWARPPNITNLDAHFMVPAEGIWSLFRAASHTALAPSSAKLVLAPREFAADSPVTVTYSDPSDPSDQLDRSAVSSTQPSAVTSAANSESESEDANGHSTEHAQSSQSTSSNTQNTVAITINPPTDKIAKQAPTPVVKAMQRLRWATLGYQYNWTDKQYFFDRNPGMPDLVAELTRDVVAFLEPVTGYSCDQSWRPEAGIINFYHPGDMLTAHQDRSELDMNAPLVSFSIGLDGVLLFGTETTNDRPIAIKLESGDVLVMTGQARRAFHGVPLVIDDTAPEYILKDDSLDREMYPDDPWTDYASFLKHTRINLNVRQVLPHTICNS